MRLQTIQVTNFRSVDDSEEFEVDRVTCLVGKNEAGKSAILLALAALNPNEATPVSMDRERDYPRRNLVRYKQIHGDRKHLSSARPGNWTNRRSRPLRMMSAATY